MSFSGGQTAGEYMEAFYSSVQRINAPAAAGPATAAASGAGSANGAARGAAAAAAGAISITIRTLAGKQRRFGDIDPQTTVAQLKVLIQDAEGIPPDQATLVHQGKVLGNERTLQSCGVVDGAVIDLLPSLRGD